MASKLPSEDEELARYEVQGAVFEVPKRYELNYVIGQGAYGIVVSGTDTETDERVAVKKVIGVFEHDRDFQKRILRELRILAHFEHENIIGLKDLVLPKDKDDFEHVYIITELMDTDLRQIVKSDQQLTDQHVQYFLYQILRGLKCIHSANVLHRDLKPGNLLLNADCELKICDFGLSRGVDFEVDPTLSTPYVATRWYRAPELLLQWETATRAMDMWSVGCIFAELLSRKVLFPGRNYLNQLDLILNVVGSPPIETLKGSEKAIRYMKRLPHQEGKPLETLFPDASEEAIDLLRKMLEFDPDKRITVENALEHPYMSGMHDPDDEPNAPSFNFSFEKSADTDDLRVLIYETIKNWKNTHDQN
eukprot:gb/GECH01008866.1/.p1 GENE.gb/GECH01008866.1/~~gb/GECH01008866.1/.p1  ORF type:complete len:363 (+),score=68.03 gb/GECH01008866.1/:1-1089(+)